MRSSRGYLGVAAAATATFLSAATARLSAQENAGPTINIGGADLGGVVTSAKGPEAGVWVIAETTDLPTKFAKMVVTDDEGRYVLPELPKAKYKVWVRGYGLVNSPKVDSEPGTILNLTAVIAPNEAVAAQYYPAIYWFSMLKAPPASDFPAPIKWQWNASFHQEPIHIALAIQRPTASAATSSATRRRARLSRNSAISIRTPAGCGASSPDRLAPRWQASSAGSTRSTCRGISRIGPTGLPAANCRSRSQNGRRASSATSSSRRTGALPRCTCTMKFPPIGAIRRSMPTARSTGQPDEHGQRSGAGPGQQPRLQHQAVRARIRNPVVGDRTDPGRVALLG